MSQAHIEQFYAIASKDRALFGKMMEGTQGLEDFVANAVTEARTLGYTFSCEEASAWIKKQQDMHDSGELSDQQLEAVAGGKGEAWARDSAAAGKALNQAFWAVGNALGSTIFRGW